MSTLALVADLVGRLPMCGPPEHEITHESWALGGRHHGRVYEGAEQEAAAPDISFRRAMLLRAVMRRHKGL